MEVCERKYGKEWQQIKEMGVSNIGMENLCDIGAAGNVGSRIHQYKLQLDSTYNCNVTPNPYCSDFELALIQWHNSTVTLNPPEQLPELKPSTSFSHWRKDVKAIEYEYFIRTYIA